MGAELPVFLKEIQIQGFKSFADRIRLELSPGLSVIVGPNGSGKSNVVDALRWVLGEQSAKSLRGSKMEDVIFAGSSRRRSVGMAEVTLVFDNTSGLFPLDFREVTITRRVYRDGEGQYFINKAPCRLKDIHELFMDTGAGKEGFSIIGQGRVEEILNSKAEDRRFLIEEAAGISKYRLRKREALKRLEDTERNLERLEDIKQELETQLEPLGAQAEAARRCLELAEEKRRLEIELAVSELSGVEEKAAKARQEQAGFIDAQAQAQAELARAEALALEDRLALNRAEERLQEQQQAVFAAEQQSQRAEADLKLIQERAQHTFQQLQRAAAECGEEEKKRTRIQEKIESLAGRRSVLKATVKDALARLKDKEERLQELKDSHGVNELERLKAELFEVLAAQSRCSNELTECKHNLAAVNQELEQISAEGGAKKAQVQELTASEADLGSSLKQIEHKEEEYARQQETCRQKLAELEQALTAENRAERDLGRRLEQTKAKYQALKALEDSLEGYQRGVREVLLAKKQGVKACSGLCGTVADLVSVEGRYELAVETAAGGSLQSVVAESLDAAKASIAYLKEQNLGRATFLPLDVIQGSRLEPERAVKSDPGFIGVAAALVEAAEKYRPAVDFVLGRTLVASDMETATRIARASGYKVRIVTLDGDQIYPGGSLTGGSVQRRGPNFLTRARELKELVQALASLEQQKEIQEQKLVRVRAHLEQAESEQGALDSTGRELREEKAVLGTQMEQVRQQLKRLGDELKLLGLRRQESEMRQQETTAAFNRAEAALAEIEERAGTLRQDLARREQLAKETAAGIEVLTGELTESKVQAAKWEQELAQAEALLSAERLALEETENALAARQADEEKLRQALAVIEREQEQLEQGLADARERLRSEQEALVRVRLEKEARSAAGVQREEELLSRRREVQELEQKLHALEVRLARLEAEWESGLKHLAEDFELSWEEAKELKNSQSQERTAYSREHLAQRIQEIRTAIEEIGPVNQAAIEEYPKLVQRHEFLTAQHRDLVDAHRTLRALIAELDKTMSERFQVGFEAVREAFSEVFKELFHGGQAELRLVDPDNLLETGIEIVAQPPGKKLQLLSLLSGGERALTAIALLFALLRVKPSPFCVLDEIEASLDDANVARFAEYLRRLSHSTQFIVISHRKGTMEAADVLCGITMEESGVSKLLTVKMEEPWDENASA
ncbi:chromosome segregation protein SMC [Paradesulfitobacterium ferrireducens]|uniref:chromosome segregation protein SMC n=1 Tax=Paradesulfitobacterium ferrireducens TaxID=2816476 RepID=UPI001A8D933C|nr:chromosome segregation protein SMC [Paradesulfitobacterium ferrireducens]